MRTGDTFQAEQDMDYNEPLAQRVRGYLIYDGITEKPLSVEGIEALLFLLNGNSFITVVDSGLILHVGPEDRNQASTDPDVMNHDFTRRVLAPDFVFIRAKGVKTDEQLKGWIEKAWKFVNGLPGK